MNSPRSFPGIRYDRDHLPAWYTRPRPQSSWQFSLFALAPSELGEVLAALRISVDDLNRWNRQGWLSFDEDLGERIEDWHINELVFVRDVVRSGLSDAQIEVLLDELPKPMNFDPTIRQEWPTVSVSDGWKRSPVLTGQ